MSITESPRSAAAAGPEQLAPFGWYPDPAGSSDLRLWDGHSWTTRLEPADSGVQPAYHYTTDGTVTRRIDY